MSTKSLSFLVVIFIITAGLECSAQVEVQGTGTTSATNTFITKNSNSDTSMLVRDDGNVGINTTHPSRELEVNGIIYSSGGGFQFPDGSILNSAFLTVNYAKVFTVALTGGNFNSIQAAIAACAGASKTNPYLVRVMPGIYNEPFINCQKFVDLRGSGKYSCTITGTVFGADSCVIENFNILTGIVCNGKSPFILHNIITRTDSAFSVGIKVTNQGRPWIKENDIVDCNNYGILCDGFGSDAWIIANNILRNGGGGIRCQNSSPTISNNIIDFNDFYGIYVAGNLETTPSEPTIDDNVIGHTTSPDFHGIGIAISFYAEPRVDANDIYINDVGIEIDPPAQPSILSNNINYNLQAGIRCFSNGSTKRVVIMGNHIHSNTGTSGTNSAGIFIGNCNPMITQNNITQNRRGTGSFPDIDYSLCNFFSPMISLNVYDNISRSPIGPAGGNYNVTSTGAMIAP
jgi:hypothetical protein